jgi:hypothetical protein
LPGEVLILMLTEAYFISIFLSFFIQLCARMGMKIAEQMPKFALPLNFASLNLRYIVEAIRVSLKARAHSVS